MRTAKQKQDVLEQAERICKRSHLRVVQRPGFKTFAREMRRITRLERVVRRLLGYSPF